MSRDEHTSRPFGTHEGSTDENGSARSEETREKSTDDLGTDVLSQGEEQEAEDEETVRGELSNAEKVSSAVYLSPSSL